MKRLILLTVLIPMAILIAGCETTPANESNLTLCPAERPQVCTMIYDPVCGQTDAGVRKTFASGCTACGDAEVVGHEPGVCAEG